MEKRSPIVKTGILIIFGILSISFIYPFIFMVLNAIKTKAEYNMSPFALPQNINIDNFVSMISQFKIFMLFKNSFIVSASSVILLLVFGLFSSYSFAKLNFKGKKWLYLAIISTMFIPGQVSMIPAYVMFAKIGLVNNYLSVILSYLAGSLPGVILLMTSSFRGISNELIESSKIDGCNYFQTVKNIIIPMGLPAIIITIIFNFLGFWNDLFTPMILLSGMEVRTVVVALAAIMGRYTGDAAYQMAGLLLSTMPAVIVYLLCQKYIVKGMTMGSFK